MGELCAAILTRGMEFQIKRGLGREYAVRTEPLSTLKGRIRISESLKSQRLLKRQMICSHDEFTIDSLMNRVIKSVMLLLLTSDISSDRKRNLRKLLVYLTEINTIDVQHVNWNFQYNRSNETYRLLMFICRLVTDGLLLRKSQGKTQLAHFLDDRSMSHLYEKFILEYYRKEHHSEFTADASQIPWKLDDGIDSMLPVMQTDITLQKNNRVLIIDAKYYERTMQERFNIRTQHSGNLYQIFTYVKNKQQCLPEGSPAVSGMLLYAKTDEEVVPKNEYQMSGNHIEVRTLDLSGNFQSIQNQLDNIVRKYFNN
jgi:5-methylcytosine-specific restriction enzyme subunit McrC